MTIDETAFTSLPPDKAEMYKQFYAMMRSSYEFGLSAQRVLIRAGVLRPEHRLFLTREERRRLTCDDVIGGG